MTTVSPAPETPSEASFEHDVTLLDRYLAYSTELTRLSLLGIGAIGYLLTTNPFAGRTSTSARVLMVAALLTFLAAAGAGLMHRYVGPDSLAQHLIVRRGDTSKEQKAERDRKFRLSGRLLAASATCLFLGATMVAGSFVLLL